MSGEKCARVDLTAEAKRELGRILENARENAAVLVNLSNLLGRLKGLKQDTEHYLCSTEISEGFRRKLEAFQVLAAQFIARFDDIRSRLDQLEQLRSREDPTVARDGANRLHSEIKLLTRELEQLADEMEQQLKGVEESIADEDRAEEYRAMQDARRQLTGLLEEVKLRLHPATSFNLQSVLHRANALTARIEELCKRQSPVSESEVGQCRAELNEMSREADVNEQERQKQWAIFSRLNRAFQEAGFRLDTPVRMPQHGVPIKSRHVIAEEETRASVNTMVSGGGEEVSLNMWGASGDRTVVVGKDQHCDLNLARIVDRALKLGLVIRSVSVRDPDSPSGWTAMVVPGVEREGTDEEADEETPAQGHAKEEFEQQSMEYKS